MQIRLVISGEGDGCAVSADQQGARVARCARARNNDGVSMEGYDKMWMLPRAACVAAALHLHLLLLDPLHLPLYLC